MKPAAQPLPMPAGMTPSPSVPLPLALSSLIWEGRSWIPPYPPGASSHLCGLTLQRRWSGAGVTLCGEDQAGCRATGAVEGPAWVAVIAALLREDEKPEIEKVGTLLGDSRVILNSLLSSERCLCIMPAASRHSVHSFVLLFPLVYRRLRCLSRKRRLKAGDLMEVLSPACSGGVPCAKGSSVPERKGGAPGSQDPPSIGFAARP